MFIMKSVKKRLEIQVRPRVGTQINRNFESLFWFEVRVIVGGQILGQVRRWIRVEAYDEIS